MKNKNIIFILFALLGILTLSACQSEYVYYNDIELERSKLSRDTIKWLEEYNNLSEEYKANMTYLPPDLEGLLIEMGVLGGEEIIYEKPKTMITKVLDIQKTDDGYLFLISADKLYWCSVKDASKLKEGYMVEVIYSNVKNEKGRYIISPISVTLISGTYNYVGFIMDVVDTLWKDTSEVDNKVSKVILDLVTVPSISDTDKVGLLYLLNEKYDVEFKIGSRADKTDKDMIISFYIWDNSQTDDVLFFFDVKKEKTETQFMKYVKCAAIAEGNQLVFVKDYDNRTDINVLNESEGQVISDDIVDDGLNDDILDSQTDILKNSNEVSNTDIASDTVNNDVVENNESTEFVDTDKLDEVVDIEETGVSTENLTNTEQTDDVENTENIESSNNNLEE